MAKAINNDVRATSEKKFKPTPKRPFPVGELYDITVSKAKATDKMKFFSGMEIPRLSFHFRSYGDQAGVKPSFYHHSYLAVEHTNEEITKPWKWDAMVSTIKHFHEVLSGRTDLTAEEIKLLTLDLEETDESNAFKYQEPATVIAAWEKFFNNVVTVFKGTGKTKSILTTEDGKLIPVWMKLLLYVVNKGKEVWINDGDYGFTTFPGEGLIERYIPGKTAPQLLSIRVEKGEYIIAKERPAQNAAAQQQRKVASAAGTTVSTDEIPTFLNNQPDADDEGDDLPY